MIVKELVTGEILPLKTSDTCSFALAQMEENRVQHMPVVNERELLGVISEFDIVNYAGTEEAIGNVPLSLSSASLSEQQHVYDAFNLVTEMKLTIIPVTDIKGNYLGVVTLQKLVEYFAMHSSMMNPGGIIVLQMSENNVSMSEISRIVESNDAKILNMCLNSYDDSTMVDITLKLNVIDIVPVIQTLQRYNYNIKAIFGERDDMDDLRDRYDALMNYLNI
jgi:CBS domain-containing protein